MMDHQDACQMWCPWRPLQYDDGVMSISSYRKNESFSLSPHSRCITFDCMAWRDGECVRLIPKEPT